MILIRLILLPFKLVLALLGITLKTGYHVGKLPVRVGARTARLVSLRGWLFFFAGLAVGLLVAPGPGRELRTRLQRMLDQATGSEDDLAEKVAFELAHAPRTWHLPQPQVSVDDARITLRGTVTVADARDELGRVAGAIPGVAVVENLIEILPASVGAEL